MRPFISLCMIARDEADVLSRCLTSVSGLIDEIVIVDTGSKDNTREIAASHRAQVYEYSWAGDFAAARNFALSKANGQWILVLDADEYVVPSAIPDLLSYLKQLDPFKPTGVISPVYNFVGNENSGKISISSAIRLFTRHPDLAFVRPIHEQLQSHKGDLIQIKHDDFVIYHTGYTTETLQRKKKNERNETIFRHMKQSGNWTCYDSFTLANEYFAQDRYEDAIPFYTEADQPSETDKSWLSLCIGNRVSCLLKLERYTEAYVHIKRGQSKWPKACDFYWLEGHMLSLLGLEDEAINSLETCLKLAEASSQEEACLISPNYGTTLPLQLTASLYLRRFESPQAVYTLTKLCYANPNLQSALIQLIKLIAESEPQEHIDRFLQSLYPVPEPHQLIMILEAFTQLGLHNLSKSYWNRIMDEGIKVPASVQLQYALLIDEWNLAKSAIENPPEEMGQVWLASILRAHSLWPEHSDRLANLLPTEAMSDTIAEAGLRFYREQRFEQYDALIGGYPQLFTELANRLGNAFFEERQFELAFDYYSLLLQQEALEARGYENIARLYLNQGEVDEGLDFADQASLRLPNRVDLQIIKLKHVNDRAAKELIIRNLQQTCPGLQDFPFPSF